MRRVVVGWIEPVSDIMQWEQADLNNDDLILGSSCFIITYFCAVIV